MFLDQRGRWLNEVRFVLQGAAYPIQLAVSSPSAAWRWLQDVFETRAALRAENERLRARERELELRTMRYEALARENAQLRGLRAALPPVAEKWLVAEVVNAEPNSLSQTLLLNRGSRNGVFEAQAVLDDRGLLGQTTHVGPWSAEVILITDPEHALPVQIERTGLRTIAVGTGTGLALPYLPANADVRVGDLLVTSGLGGVFPQGYPVARVTAISREAVQPLAQVRAAPLARIDRVREVMLVWFRADHPAAPGPTSNADLPVGDPAAQPQPVPPKESLTSAKPAAPRTTAPAKVSPRTATGPSKPAEPSMTRTTEPPQSSASTRAPSESEQPPGTGADPSEGSGAAAAGAQTTSGPPTQEPSQ